MNIHEALAQAVKYLNEVEKTDDIDKQLALLRMAQEVVEIVINASIVAASEVKLN